MSIYSTKWVTAEQTGQTTEPFNRCTRVYTERTRTFVADGRRSVDRVTAVYQPEQGVSCWGADAGRPPGVGESGAPPPTTRSATPPPSPVPPTTPATTATTRPAAPAAEGIGPQSSTPAGAGV